MTMAVRKTDEELTDKRKCKIGGLITDWGGGNRAIWPSKRFADEPDNSMKKKHLALTSITSQNSLNSKITMSEKLITVTSPLLPNLDDFNEMLKQIWASKWITNNGDFHKQLEKELAAYLKVPYISLFTNGTLPRHCRLCA